MIGLDGYDVLDVLTASDGKVLLRARPKAGGETVVVKLLTDDQPTAEDEARLRHECAIAAGLPDDAIVRPLGVRRFGRRLGLVLIDTGGESLTAKIGPAGMELDACLRIATSLARSLARLHESEVIHRDVKPANVIVDADLTAARLADFGIATRLPRVHTDTGSPSHLEGTLAYMAPEQTGRMNRSVDQRSDLYAFGMTLHQMLIGGLPFKTTDPLELVHHHLAVVPVAPADLDRRVPRAVSDIVERLLAKCPEDRYQSASGLAHDLASAAAALATHGRIDAFELGTQDFADRLDIPDRLYGRDAETSLTFSILDEATSGTATLLLVSGHAGIGKTALVRELHKPVAARHGHLVAGKFDQFSRNIPYAAVAQAFGSLVRGLLAEPEARVRAWRSELADALGSNVGVVAEVIPDLRLVCGDDPPPPTLGTAEAENRLHVAFGQFVRVLARGDQPLVVFLDDLHWADAASLRLMTALLSDPAVLHLLLVGAYRPAEVAQSDPLAIMLTALPAERVRRVEVGPLSGPDVTELVADALRTTRAAAASLAALLHDRSGGNPFFLGQLLQSIAADKLLRAEAGGWTWDLDSIKAHGLTGDVVELMVKRLSGLPGDCRDALRIAAVIGNEFDLDILAAAVGQPNPAVANALWPAIAAGLLLPLGEAHELLAAGLTDTQVRYRFLHDRVQQAGHESIPPVDRPAAHGRVGALLRARLGDGDEGLFAVVEHLNAAVNDDAPDLDLAALNLRAAHRAMASSAFDAAADLLALARRRLPLDVWASHYGLAHDLHLTLGEALAVLGRIEESEAAYDHLLRSARDPIDAAKGQASRAEGLLGLGRVAEAESAGRQGLALAGFEVSLAEGRDRLDGMLTVSAAHRLLRVGTANERDALITRLFRAAILAAQFRGSAERDVLIACAVEHVAVGGGSRHCGLPIASFAELAARTGHHEAGNAYAAAANELAARHHDVLQPVVLALTGLFCTVWTRPVVEHIQTQHEAFLACAGQGMPIFANYPIHAVAWIVGMAGGDQAEHLAAWERAADYGRRFAPLAVDTDLLVADGVRRLVSPDAERLDPGPVVATLSPLNPMIVAMSFAFVSDIHAMLGEYDLALRFAREAATLFASRGGVTPGAPVFHLNLGWAVAGARLASEQDDHAPRTTLLAEAQDAADRLRPLLALPPGIFAGYGHLVDAELARARGEHDRAAGLYLASIDEANAHDYPLLEAWAHELMGRLHVQHGRTLAAVHLREARALYLRCNALGKVARIDAEFADLAPRAPRRSFDATVTAGDGADALDLAAVAKASRAIAAELSPDKVVERLEAVAVTVAGATRATFLSAERKGDLGGPSTFDLPIVRNDELAGTLRLEFADGPSADGPAILRLLAPQMAISLENAHLYADLEAQVAARSGELAGTLEELQVMQDQIVTSEKLAALGGLVAGVAHEISTPVSVAVTASSHLAQRAAEFDRLASAGPLRRSDLESFLGTTSEAGELILANLRRAADLVQSFKQVAVDQTGEAPRTFAVKAYLEQIVASLGPKLASTRLRVEIDCDPTVTLSGYPGALAQVITNLVMNSLRHAYPDAADGVLRFAVTASQDSLRIVSSDDGCGIPADVLPRIFDPFFTTRRSSGGSGLGLHIAHNLVTQRLGGTISAESTPGHGTRFTLEIPITAEALHD